MGAERDLGEREGRMKFTVRQSLLERSPSDLIHLERSKRPRDFPRRKRTPVRQQTIRVDVIQCG